MSYTVLSMKDGKTWRKAKILPYTHTIAPYGAVMASLPSQIACGGWWKYPPSHSVMAVPWSLFNNTEISQTKASYFSNKPSLSFNFEPSLSTIFLCKSGLRFKWSAQLNFVYTPNAYMLWDLHSWVKPTIRSPLSDSCSH